MAQLAHPVQLKTTSGKIKQMQDHQDSKPQLNSVKKKTRDQTGKATQTEEKVGRRGV